MKARSSKLAIFLGAVAVLVAFSLSPIQAGTVGFKNYYDPANWTTTVVDLSLGGSHSGSVNTASAPSSVTLNSTSTPDSFFGVPLLGAGFTTFTIVAPSDGPVSFDYSYDQFGSSGILELESAGILINGVPIPLEIGTPDDTGSITFNVSQGDTFGFFVSSADLTNPNSSGANFTISNFDAPIPEPASIVLWSSLSAACFGAGWLRRRRAQRAAVEA